MWSEIGSRRLQWFAAAGWEPDEKFTLEDLAPRMGLTVNSVKAIYWRVSTGGQTLRSMHIE